MQAKLFEHSAFETHSGRQFGGDPIYSLRQEHDGESPTGRHSAFGPHGEGLHGFVGSAGLSTKIYNHRLSTQLRMNVTQEIYQSESI